MKEIIVKWFSEGIYGYGIAMKVVKSDHERFTVGTRFDYGFFSIATKEGYTITSLPIEASSHTDFEIGMLVTIDEWIDSVDHSWVGDPMEILAIDGNFVKLKFLNCSGHCTENFDLRQVKLKGLNKEFHPEYFAEKSEPAPVTAIEWMDMDRFIPNNVGWYYVKNNNGFLSVQYYSDSRGGHWSYATVRDDFAFNYSFTAWAYIDEIHRIEK